MPEQKLTWEQIPEGVRMFVRLHWPFADLDFLIMISTELVEIIKPELKKAFKEGMRLAQEDERNQGFIYKMKGLDDFETWYQNAYLK